MTETYADGASSPRAAKGAVALGWSAWVVPLAAAILILPVWLAKLPSMPDFPAHLATFYMLAGGANDPHLAHYYRVEWTFVPNLAAEFVVVALAKAVPVLVATKIFLSATIALWVLGCASIEKVLFGRAGAAVLPASFFAYNANFMWGFFNYCFATGLGFFVFAAWIANQNRRGPLTLLVFAALVTLVYFCHVFAAATLLLIIGCYELGGMRTISLSDLFERMLPVFIVAVPSMIAFVFLKPHGIDAGHLEFNLGSTLDDRTDAAIQYTFDKPALILFFALVVLFVVGVWLGKIVVHPRMTLLLSLLAIAVIFVPEWAMGGWGVDLRLPPVLGALAFASGEWRMRERTVKWLAGATMILLAWQSAALAGNWQYYSKQFSEFRAAEAKLPAGSKLLTVLDGNAIGKAADQPYWHMAEYAIIDRGAFTPLLFTTKGQHVIQLQPAVRSIAASTAEQGRPPDISELDDLASGNTRDDPDIHGTFPYLIHFQCHFDYAIVIHAGGKQTKPPDMLARVHVGKFFSLYRITQTQGCGR